jgi:hypothetical protein
MVPTCVLNPPKPLRIRLQCAFSYLKRIKEWNLAFRIAIKFKTRVEIMLGLIGLKFEEKLRVKKS